MELKIRHSIKIEPTTTLAPHQNETGWYIRAIPKFGIPFEFGGPADSFQTIEWLIQEIAGHTGAATTGLSLQ
jgi:hypothetical protein